MTFGENILIGIAQWGHIAPAARVRNMGLTALFAGVIIAGAAGLAMHEALPVPPKTPLSDVKKLALRDIFYTVGLASGIGLMGGGGILLVVASRRQRDEEIAAQENGVALSPESEKLTPT